MKNAKSKYNHYVQDKLWNTTTTMTDIKKETDIVALNSKIDRLKALLTKVSSTTPESRPAPNSNSSSTSNSSRSGWKIIAPQKGEPWSKTVNGKIFHWCKYHNFWLTQHNSNNYCKGEKERNQSNSAPEPSLELNVASIGNELYPEASLNLASGNFSNVTSHHDFDSAPDDACCDKSCSTDGVHTIDQIN